MAEKTINARIRCKIDTAENWKTNNPVLLVGELGVESDTKLMKVGDGTTSWTSLPYLQYLPLSGGQLTGALKIANGYDKGIQDSEGNNLLYMSSDYVLNIRNEAYDDININGVGEIKIGGSKITSDINVIGRSFIYNDKSVAVKSDIPTALSQLSEDTTHRVVTDTEKATWNAKSNFDGNYNSLTNKPTIPTKTSQLTNDSNFATTSQIPDISGKANLSGGNVFTGTQTFNNGIILANDTAINNASGNNVITTQTGGHTILGDPNGLINIQGSTIRPLYTKKDSGSAALALYSDIPTQTSQLTNNSGYITSSAVPTKLSQLTNDKSFISSAGYISCAQSRNWGMGYIDYALSDGHKLRHEFGQAWINDGVTFTNAYSTVLWCTATPDCSNDSQIQRFSINSCSTTKMTFKGGADQIVRWEVWGIIN